VATTELSNGLSRSKFGGQRTHAEVITDKRLGVRSRCRL